jgi:hypothetical protein
MTKLIVNVKTGETTERELNAEELAQYEADQAVAATQAAELEAKASEKAAILERLGITAEEAKLLLS